jgi:hypothetical protein
MIICKSKGCKTKQAGVTVHTIVRGDKFYQVDIKVCPLHAKVAQYHRHDIRRVLQRCQQTISDECTSK